MGGLVQEESVALQLRGGVDEFCAMVGVELDCVQLPYRAVEVVDALPQGT